MQLEQKECLYPYENLYLDFLFIDKLVPPKLPSEFDTFNIFYPFDGKFSIYNNDSLVFNS